jgi:hypothetical protein
MPVDNGTTVMFQPLLISAGVLLCSLLCYAMIVAIIVGLVE